MIKTYIDDVQYILKIYYVYMEYKDSQNGNEIFVYVFNNSYIPNFLKTSYANASKITCYATQASQFMI